MAKLAHYTGTVLVIDPANNTFFPLCHRCAFKHVMVGEALELKYEGQDAPDFPVIMLTPRGNEAALRRVESEVHGAKAGGTDG